LFSNGFIDFFKTRGGGELYYEAERSDHIYEVLPDVQIDGDHRPELKTSPAFMPTEVYS